MEKSSAAARLTQPVPSSQWGRDHWSTLGYIETRCVDYGGVPDRKHMRCDHDRHPLFWGHKHLDPREGKKYPTVLADGLLLDDHDDWDCANDIEVAGFLENKGAGINPVFRLTPLGLEVCAKLRAHKANEGSFSSFRLVA